jgi:hypothetical protein
MPGSDASKTRLYHRHLIAKVYNMFFNNIFVNTSPPPRDIVHMMTHVL